MATTPFAQMNLTIFSFVYNTRLSSNTLPSLLAPSTPSESTRDRSKLAWNHVNLCFMCQLFTISPYPFLFFLKVCLFIFNPCGVSRASSNGLWTGSKICRVKETNLVLDIAFILPHHQWRFIYSYQCCGQLTV